MRRGRIHLYGGPALLAAGVLVLGAAVRAQDLNTRTDSAPSADAKLGRIVSQSALEAPSKQGLMPHDVVNNTCGPLQVGNTPPPSDKRPLNQDNSVVIRGNVVNVCR